MGLALVCADGRLHQEAVHYNGQLAREMGVDVVDVVAVPGPDGLFKPGREDERQATLRWFNLLIGAHNPVAIAIVGHYNCAGNPEGDSEHDADVSVCAAGFKAATGFEGKVMAFSTERHADDQWSLKQIPVAESTPVSMEITTSA